MNRIFSLAVAVLLPLLTFCKKFDEVDLKALSAQNIQKQS